MYLPGDEDLPFDIDPFVKLMILAGTDELGYLLSKEPRIAAWETSHAPRIDTRSAPQRTATRAENPRSVMPQRRRIPQADRT